MTLREDEYFLFRKLIFYLFFFLFFILDSLVVFGVIVGGQVFYLHILFCFLLMVESEVFVRFHYSLYSQVKNSKVKQVSKSYQTPRSSKLRVFVARVALLSKFKCRRNFRRNINK